MIQSLVLTASGRPSSPYGQRSHPSLRVDTRISPTAPHRVASTSSCGPGARGGCSQRSWVAAMARPAGAACATGSQPASGSGYTRAAFELAGQCSGHRLVPSHCGLAERPRQKRSEPTGPSPFDQGKPGSKYHLVDDRKGIPMTVQLSAANAHDVTQLIVLVDAIPVVIGSRTRLGRSRKRPATPPQHT
jgi:hypothetical protein